MNFKPFCLLVFALLSGPFTGISQAAEKAAATAPVSSMPDEDSDVDEDGSSKPDGLSNQDEALVGTDPLDPDSDDDEMLDGAEAVPLSDQMMVPAARELRYAVIRLGIMKNAHGVNSRGEVLLVDYGGSETTQGYLWKNGVSQIIGTGLRGSFRGPMEDGTVYFATPTEVSSFTDSFGPAVTLKSRLMAWQNGAATQAGLFYESHYWEGRPLPSFPTNHPTTEFLNAYIEPAYTSAWSAMRSAAVPPAVPPDFSFSPQGYTHTTSSGALARFNDLGDRTYSFSASFSSTFSGPAEGQFNLPGQIELTGWMSTLPGYSSGQGYWKLNSPPEPNDTTNLPRDIIVNNSLRAVARTNGGVIKWLVPGPDDVPIPNVAEIFDLNNYPNEGPYMLGTDLEGNLQLLCYGGGAFPRIPLNGLGTISQDQEAVVSRKISENLLIPADNGIWRNQRFRPLSEITSYDPNGQDYFTINQVSPTNDFLLGYGYFGAEAIHEGVLLLPADLDFIHPATGEMSESREASQGGYIALRENEETPVTKLKLHKLEGIESAEFILTFSSSKIKIWKDAGRTQAVISGNTTFPANKITELFIEGVEKSAAAKDIEIGLKVKIGSTESSLVMSKATVVQSEYKTTIQAFIPYLWVDVPFDWILPPFFTGQVAIGDNRGYDEGLTRSFRARQTIVVVPYGDLTTDTTKSNDALAGASEHYKKTTSVPQEEQSGKHGYNFTSNPERLAGPSGGLITGPYETIISVSSKIVSVNTYLWANEGILGGASLPIRWNVTVTFDVTDPVFPKISLIGQRSGFPAFEIYVEDSNKTNLPLYQWTPDENRDVWSLGLFESFMLQQPVIIP